MISENIKEFLNQISKKYKKINFAFQKNQLGTGDAVLAAFSNKQSLKADLTLILYADTPLITKNTLSIHV